MPGADGDREVGREREDGGREPVRYPTHHIVAVLDTEDQVADAAAALTGGGFLVEDEEMEIKGHFTIETLARPDGS